jgi:hypothetical protein
MYPFRVISCKIFRLKIKSEKMRTFVADIADAKILCNKVVSMSGKVGFEWQYKTKTYHSFFTNI